MQHEHAALSLKNLTFLTIIIAGGLLALLAISADLVGLASLLNNELRTQLLWLGVALAGIGAVADATLGARSVPAWLKSHASDWQGLLKFLGIAVQLGVLASIMRLVYLEHNAFYHNVMLLTFYGFIIHYFLPQNLRLPFFIVLSLAGFTGVIGLANSAWLVGISLTLIGICHLPVPFLLRGLLLLGIGIALTASRMGYFETPWTKAIWPVLASMLMFRLIIYLYDLKHKKAPKATWKHTLAYFFLLPNVAFPLFPVVDFATFCRTYYNEDQYKIYQRGVKWMLWGVVHLLIFRYVNYYLVLSPAKVTDIATLAQYMVSNYLFIIKLSGQFHLIVGMLLLFGFNLPRIMDVFLLATGFTDYWRRVNVYWKDFVQKVFYYPIYFKMRKVGNTAKLLLATGFGFLVTWFFHGYQWLWIRGEFPFSIPDTIFWTSLAVLVAANSLWESKHSRRVSLGAQTVKLQDVASKTLRATGMFIVMTILWSIWISPSLGAWYGMLTSVPMDFLALAQVLLLIVSTLGIAMLIFEKWKARPKAVPEAKMAFPRVAWGTAAMVVVLYFLVQPEFYHRLGPEASHLITDLRSQRLNAQDAELLERGYYEQLTNVHTFNSQLWELYMQKPDDWKALEETDAVRYTGDFLKYELEPNIDMTLKYARFRTNRWGMRDDDYEQQPAPDSYRIAMVGGSITQGTGVVHEETFEYLLEQKLNREHNNGKYAKYDVLNFAVGGYNLFQTILAMEKKVFDFKPNAVFNIAHVRDEARAFRYLLDMPRELIPFDELRDILERANIQPDTKPNKAFRRLEPYMDDILRFAYSKIVELCKQREVLPVWICLPSEPGEKANKQTNKLVQLARQTGFVVLDLSDVYDGHIGASLQVAVWDKHPNAIGHRLIAERMYQALRGMENQIPLGLTTTRQAMSSPESE